jgi:UDP-glucose 4-epimerase
MKRYLITGGAGFIGGRLARRLIAEGHSISILDLPKKLKDSPVPANAEIIAGDISQAQTFAALNGSFDAVIHLAAQTSARVSHEEPERDLDTNARGTLLLARWCVSNNVPRLLYGSSMGIYGNPLRLPVRETDTPMPVSFYGVTKLAGEHYLQAHVPLGLQPTIFRMFNVYGPGQDMANLKQGMVSVYLAYIHEAKSVPVTGSLERFRDFIYIDDVIDAFMLALHPKHDKRSHGEIYNVGSGVTHTVRQVLDLLIEAYGRDPKTYPVKEVEGHAGDIFGMHSDSTKLQKAFAWIPKVTLRQGIERMVTWLREEVAR